MSYRMGYPKFTASSYVRQGDSKIIHALLGPTTLKSSLNELNVTIACTTAYPFSGKLTHTITAATSFEFAVSIPSWATANSSYRINNGKAVHLSPELEHLQMSQIYKGETQVLVDLDMAIHVGDARNGSVAIYYVPLLCALDIDLTTLSSDQITTQTHNWVLDSSSEWRYGIYPTSLTVEELYDPDQTLLNPIWTCENTPVALWVIFWQIDYTDTLGTAALPPVKPRVTGEPIQVLLIPYGSENLQIAEIPVVSTVD
ncbi:hypothetical protein N7520_008419 [Penicillium odoratum]|uniref:uncharacterized protein n=1 Tax=Penicillium odoratum TaxID=1167516 RepID=UPI002548533A|nr:uncharacterized protein N7520_008419 [Penicillium odoratum]KAJ5761263.1 hypothetical protein N7520_008419 [Penicillium odoratum]